MVLTLATFNARQMECNLASPQIPLADARTFRNMAITSYILQYVLHLSCALANAISLLFHTSMAMSGLMVISMNKTCANMV